MSALTYGIIAALCWGVHDVCVRYLSQRVNIFAALFLVVLTGTVLWAPFMLFFGTGTLPSLNAFALSAASGVAFAWTGISLYKAFSLGPVWLAAPVIGAYPILSMAWAALRGAPTTLLQWGAVLAVILGIAIVALNNARDLPLHAPKTTVVLWSIGSAIGWATTFALGQAATELGDAYDLLLLTRIVASLALLPVLVGSGARLAVGWQMFALICLLGFLDATALFLVLQSGTMARPEYASVAASTFGIITILLAWAFLGETMRSVQWIGVFIAFLGIGYLAV